MVMNLLTPFLLGLAATPSTNAAVVGSIRQQVGTQLGVVESPGLTSSGITSRDAYTGHLFKRQREEDENGALLCKNAPCVDKS